MDVEDPRDDLMKRFSNVTVHETVEQQNAEYARQAAERARAEAARAAARAKAEALNYINDLIKKYGLKADPNRVFNIHGPDIKNIEIFLNKQRESNISRNSASINSFLSSGIRKPPVASTKHSSAFTASTNHLDGGNKSRRNTRTYRHSKKHKRVRHTRRKRTRRNHRSRRHR